MWFRQTDSTLVLLKEPFLHTRDLLRRTGHIKIPLPAYLRLPLAEPLDFLLDPLFQTNEWNIYCIVTIQSILFTVLQIIWTSVSHLMFPEVATPSQPFHRVCRVIIEPITFMNTP